MKLIIRKYKRKSGSFEPDYTQTVYKTLHGDIKTVKRELLELRVKNDVARYTVWEIADIDE